MTPDDLIPVFDAHYDYFLRKATRIAGRDDAEDLVQQTFLQGVRFIGRFKGDSSLKTWLTTILQNEFLTALRYKRVRPIFVSTPVEDLDHFMVLVPASDGSSQTEERRKLLRSAINDLPPREQFSINFYLDGHSFASTGTSTIKVTKTRAVQRLKRVLA